jgi:hypothetical protein
MVPLLTTGVGLEKAQWCDWSIGLEKLSDVMGVGLEKAQWCDWSRVGKNSVMWLELGWKKLSDVNGVGLEKAQW